eukprot:scaffold4603_cov175-Amphora_coffeaeformis.AAC.5
MAGGYGKSNCCVRERRRERERQSKRHLVVQHPTRTMEWDKTFISLVQHGMNLVKQTGQGICLAAMTTHNGTHDGLDRLQGFGIEAGPEIRIHATDFGE